MIIPFDPKTRRVAIPVNGVNVFVIDIDEHGKSSVTDLTVMSYNEIASLKDRDVLTEVMQEIERANRDQPHRLFSDHDPEEANTIVYVSIPKDLSRHEIVLHTDHETLWYATDLLFEGELEEFYRLTVEDDLA